VDTLKESTMKPHQNVKPLPKLIFCLVVLVSFVGAFFIATDKREIILCYASVALISILFFLMQKVRRNNALQKPWQYNLARFLSIYLPFSLLMGFLPRLQNIPLGMKLVISAVLAGMAVAGIHFQESFWRSRSD